MAAFQTVLRAIEDKRNIDQFWCLGDIVGYGPDPENCIYILKQLNNVYVAGNHDLASIGKLSIENFNPFAAQAIEWTKKQLNKTNNEYIANMPLKQVVDDSTIVHGSPRSPVWEYV
ncbi:MAG: metallophosphoesterase family protein, partial [Chloroflexi bacterium]|nr:metallophosphoesterase family protein [Chloroflexota bacterium]